MSQSTASLYQPKTPSRTPVPKLTPSVGFNIMCEITSNSEFFANVLELMNRRGMVSPFEEQPQMPTVKYCLFCRHKISIDKHMPCRYPGAKMNAFR